MATRDRGVVLEAIQGLQQLLPAGEAGLVQHRDGGQAQGVGAGRCVVEVMASAVSEAANTCSVQYSVRGAVLDGMDCVDVLGVGREAGQGRVRRAPVDLLLSSD